MNKKPFLVLISLLLILSFITNAQTPYKKGTNVQILNQLSDQFHRQFLSNRSSAESWARANNAPIRKEFPDGTIIEIQEVINGRPYYYITDNLDAAKTVSTDKVWPGGAAGLNLDGNGMLIGEWDGGAVRRTHRELSGRVTQMDSPGSTSSHSTHVAGTLIASGVSATAKGMSPQANLAAYDWSNDESEMASAAASGLLFSNHSYSYITGWRYNYFGDSRWAWFGDPDISETEDYGFGFYIEQAQQWDEIAYNAPYYLIVKSAGNDRNDEGPSPGEAHWVYDNGWQLSTVTRDPDGGNDGFDCIPGGAGVGKNILTIGAVNDIPSGYSQPSDVDMTTFSSWGPADDGRIKPDIVANGYSLYSCDDDHDADYTTKSGTSMATPNVVGSLALIEQHYQNTHSGDAMLAATLKALVIHTADEAGTSPGPDYSYGWGLLNTKTATHVISEDETDDFVIQELELIQNGTYSMNAFSDGSEPLKITIVWTDPAGNPPSAALNPRTPMLINDLDLRVTYIDDGQIFYPWKLDVENPSMPAVTGDNVVDNVEQVFIDSPQSGNYQITVNHKNDLTSGVQNFSMIITGASLSMVECVPPDIEVEDVMGMDGDTITVNIFVEDNPTPIDAFGFKFHYCSDKLTYVEIEKGDLTSQFSFFEANEISPGTINIGGFDPNAIPAHSSGTLAKVKLVVEQCLEEETCTLNITNLTDDLTDLNICPGEFTCGPQCLLGDVNNDGVISPGDALCCFQIYLNGGTPPEGECNNDCALYASDGNCDGGITPGDALIIFNAYLNGEDPPLDCPPVPGIGKNLDTTPSEIKIIPIEAPSDGYLCFLLETDQPGGIKSFGFDLGSLMISWSSSKYLQLN